MTRTVRVLRTAAFPDGAVGGNPAGVVLDAGGLDDRQMQDLAARVGYAETAFVTSPLDPESASVSLRYFSPVAEVPFCGHATIAAALALAQLHGPADLVFHTVAGPFAVRTSANPDGVEAAFTSAEPTVVEMPPADVDRLLALLRLGRQDLAIDHPPMLADAGNVHPILVLAERAAFDAFTFDPGPLRSMMDERGWVATVTVLFVSDPSRLEARNLFPVGTMDEDPATGSAAAAVGAYLRSLGLVQPPERITILQGHHLGLPCRLGVDIPADGGITVSGTARDLAAPLDIDVVE